MRKACYLNPGRDLATAVTLARRAESLGYDSAWVTHGRGRDSFLVLAAFGAATSRLGLADGAVLWLTPPSYVRDVAVPALERGRRRAGKTLDGFETVVAVPLAITDDSGNAFAAFQNELSRYLTPPFYRAMMEASGLGEHLESFDRDGKTPVKLAEELGAVGDPAAARIYMDAYVRAGATLPAVRPITFPDAPWYARTLEEAAKF